MFVETGAGCGGLLLPVPAARILKGFVGDEVLPEAFVWDTVGGGGKAEEPVRAKSGSAVGAGNDPPEGNKNSSSH